MNSNRLPRVTLALLTVLFIVGLRVVALHSDPFPRLDWSAGLMTDEGFNIHNARNLILFGHAHTDGYDNMLLSPLFHLAQVGVFKVFGVGSVQARMISVVCGLLTLLLLWAALKRAFDKRIAFTAILFLGLDHTNLLYNRMALMDTPASLLAVMAFYAFVRGVSAERNAGTRAQTWSWLMACAALLALTVTVRTVCVYLLPVPFVVLGVQIFRRSGVGVSSFLKGFFLPLPLGEGRGEGVSVETEAPQHINYTDCRQLTPKRRFGWTEFVLLGLAMFVVFTLYFLLWYWPHHAELTAMNDYYGQRQSPNSLAGLGWNIYNAALGEVRTLSSYLFHHTPVMLTLALLGLVLKSNARSSPVETYVAAWLLLGWGLLASTSYAPSRYYVTTYPALATLAALTLWRLPELWTRFQQINIGARILRAALTWFLLYHAVAMFLDHFGLLSRGWARVLLFVLPSAFSVLDWLGVCRKNGFSLRNLCGLCASAVNLRAKTAHRRDAEGAQSSFSDKLLAKQFDSKMQNPRPKTAAAVLALWFLFNAYWLGAWLFGLDYTQYQMSRWLAQNVPSGSVLMGDVAPGVCLDNTFIAVYVEPGLWNDLTPVETMGTLYPDAPLYIVTGDRWKARFWMVHYPELVTPERRTKLAQILNWQVGVYKVKP